MNEKQKALIAAHIAEIKNKEKMLGYIFLSSRVTDMDQEEFFKDFPRREARPVLVSVDFYSKDKDNLTFPNHGHSYLFRIGPRGGLESYTDYTRKATFPIWQPGLRPITTKER